MSFTAPTADDFKAVFVRDFPYAPEKDPTNLDYITDADITRAINDGLVEFNDGLFGDFCTTIFMYLAAYHLVQNTKSAMKGITAQADFALTNVSVGSVSTGNQIVGQFAEDPNFAKYLKNAYGQKYLELAYPYTIGNVVGSEGTTTFA